ncbi:acyl dehydratase [Hoeflea marina]|uniref:Acyl dehydratase n=1 Tax=Hoeflea marina TaxID=274592 RepID=A0A317PJ09_9HYPH|nr:MaoC family dehydratase [Hoeflea marina]PWV97587.1 acyl dehydratase [Hoeflea marina]
MNHDPLLAIGERIVLGSHRFTAEDIIAFARKFDPQPFHLDAEAAARSMFGGLCASGWHTVAVWMKLNVAAIARSHANAARENQPVPEYGPSPGIRNLRWIRPVFAGSTITYSRTVSGIRPLPSRPGWSLLETTADAWNEGDEAVMSFSSAVLLRLADDDPE